MSLLALALASVPGVLAPGGEDPARALFLAQCASCHGETGDGRGVTPLERPARSFRDGGFSFGNTPEALLRTISTGIPGTAMPGFDAALTLEQRTELARYVLELGPASEPVDLGDAVLVVERRPLVVRGSLPPISEGNPERPRGLLIGTPDGLTFEYRVDDVRLLGVRQGAFVERTDWSGRGGTPLLPLGKVVYLCEGGDPEPTFTARGEPLRATLAGSFAREAGAGLSYRLSAADGTAVATVHEHVSALATSAGSGFLRSFEIEPAASGSVLAARVLQPRGALAAFFGPPREASSHPARVVGGRPWMVVFDLGDGLWQVSLVSSTARRDPGRDEALLDLDAAAPLHFEVAVLLVAEWSEKVFDTIAREVLRR